MREIRHHAIAWRSLLLLLAMTGLLTTLASCGNDEPEVTTIDYYLEVEEEFLVNGQTDHTDRYYSPITMMREVIDTAYPTPDAVGNDDAVIAACDELYLRYQQMYDGKAEHLTCLVHVVRAVMQGDIVKQGTRLKTYSFDINSPL